MTGEKGGCRVVFFDGQGPDELRPNPFSDQSLVRIPRLIFPSSLLSSPFPFPVPPLLCWVDACMDACIFHLERGV